MNEINEEEEDGEGKKIIKLWSRVHNDITCSFILTVCPYVCGFSDLILYRLFEPATR